ncbi:MAG: hypothetical protein R6X33_04710 [Candidatus Brocadiia bacterium]
MGPSLARRVIDDRRFLFGVTAVAVAAGLLGPLIAYDLWWHLKAGELILQSGAVPQTDPFSFTVAGGPWTYHSWLSGVLLWLVYDIGGMAGLVIMRPLLVGGSLLMGWFIARRRGVGPALASVLVLAACLQLRTRALVRPYLFSYVLFMPFVLVLEGVVQPAARKVGADGPPRAADFMWGRGRLLLLPLLGLLWVNLHAGFASGILVLGAFGVGQMVHVALHARRGSFWRELLVGPAGARFQAMLVAGLFLAAGTVITPHGTGTLLYPYRLLTEVRLVSRIEEWQATPLNPHYGVFWAILAVGAVAIGRSLWFSYRRGNLRDEAGRFVTDGLLFAGFAFLGARAQRHVAWVMLLAPPLLGWHVEAVSRQQGADQPPSGLRYGVLVLLLALAVGLWPAITGTPPSTRPSPRKLPVAASDFIERHDLMLRPYNAYSWGGYMIWRFWPRMRVFIDGRCLVYGDELIGEAMRINAGHEGWKEALERRDVEMLVLKYRKQDASHFFTTTRWRCVYWDDVAIVALRRDMHEKRSGELPPLDASNPAVFDLMLEALSPESILPEIDLVLERDPNCWTAHTFRARCLLKQAQQNKQAGEDRLEAAFAAAQRAVELAGNRTEPWEALAQVAQALGRNALAQQAAGKAERYSDDD